MSDLLKPGVYPAKLQNYGILISKAGKPNAVIDFECEGKILRKYFGLDNDLGLEYTVKTLSEMGYTSTKLDDFSEGKGLRDQEYFLVVENENYNGIMKDSIKFINLTKDGPSSTFLSKAEAINAVKGINFGAKIAFALQGKTAKTEVKF
ncbi:MAG: hypothetical protein AAB787_01210 [Patescibacteria group bacterium]